MPPRLPLRLIERTVGRKGLPHICPVRIPFAFASTSKRRSRMSNSPIGNSANFQPKEVDRRREQDISQGQTKRRKLSQDFSTLEAHKKAGSDLHIQKMDLSLKIELTPLEDTVRTLLLDVVDYIEKHPKHKGKTQDVDEGLVLRYTGGWVRDKILGVESQDIDVGISSMTGYQFGRALKEYLDNPHNLNKYKKIKVPGVNTDKVVSLHTIAANPEKSKHLETVTTNIFGLDVDLVNLRKETYTKESRNPQMEFGTPQEDALRRDATVNSLFYNLNTSSVEDMTGRGLEDMKNRLIRTPLPPYQTFIDDPLRVLRLIRFASRLGYQVVPETAEAMKHNDIREVLKAKISPERVGTEIQKILQGHDPLSALIFIDNNNLYNTIFANQQDSVETDTSAWSEVYFSLSTLLGTSDTEIPLLIRQSLSRFLIRDENERYLAWLLAALAPWSTVSIPENANTGHPNKSKMVPYAAGVIRDSLRLDNKTFSLVSIAVTHHQAISDFKRSFVKGSLHVDQPEVRRQTGLLIRSAGPEWRQCFLLSLLLETAEGDGWEVFNSYNEFLLAIEKMDLLDAVSLRPLLNGHELSNGLGVKPGPWMQRALAVLIEWQLKNPGLEDKDLAMEEIRRRKDDIGYEASGSVGSTQNGKDGKEKGKGKKGKK